jgi:hypothetical protein
VDLGGFFRALVADMVALLSGIGSVGLLVAGLIYWDKPIPRWIALLVSALCFVFAAIRIWEKERKSAESYKEALRQERERAQQPDVAIVWDWTNEEKGMLLFLGSKKKSILVDNRSDQHVYRVNVQPIPVPQHCPMNFDEINEIAPRSQCVVVGRWAVGSEVRSTATDGYNQYIAANSEGLTERGWIKKKTHSRGIGNIFVEIPMTATFETHNATWKIEFDWHYSPGDDDTCFVRRGGGRV